MEIANEKKTCVFHFCWVFTVLTIALYHTSPTKAAGSVTEAMSEQRLQRLNEQLTAARKEAEVSHGQLMEVRNIYGQLWPWVKTVVPGP